MPRTRTASGKQVLSISITDADRTLLEQHCGPKEIGAFLGRLLRSYDSQVRLGDNILAKRMERIEQCLHSFIENRKEMSMGR